MSKITDYGIVLLAELASDPEGSTRNARELANDVQLPLPIVSKTLKALARRGLLASHRGAKGGFNLARQPEEISVAEVIGALEGALGLTECGFAPGACDREPICRVRAPWERINSVIGQALRQITLADLIEPRPLHQIMSTPSTRPTREKPH